MVEIPSSNAMLPFIPSGVNMFMSKNSAKLNPEIVSTISASRA